MTTIFTVIGHTWLSITPLLLIITLVCTTRYNPYD